MLALLVASSVAAGLRHRTSSAHPDAPATLGVLTIFRNEAQVLHEWVAHYRAEGVTQFVMIDDRSTDGSAALAHSLAINGDITVVPSEGAGTQAESLMARAPLLTTEWIFVCDLDEFAFGKTMTIGAYLATVPDECGGVLWYGPYSATYTVYTPFAAGMKELPPQVRPAQTLPRCAEMRRDAPR